MFYFILYLATKTGAFDWLKAGFYILKKLQLSNQYLVMKMQSNAKKTSNILSFLFFTIAKRFARNLFASCFQKNICNVMIRMWILLRCFTSLSLFFLYLSIRNVKHLREFISSSLRGCIIHYGVPFEYRWEYSWKPCAVKKIGHILRYYRIPSKCTVNKKHWKRPLDLSNLSSWRYRSLTVLRLHAKHVHFPIPHW